MRERWLRPGIPVCVLCAFLCATMAVGPAAAQPSARLAQAQPDPDDDDDVPVPPAPPPVEAQPPAPAPQPPPPAQPPAQYGTPGTVYYGPAPAPYRVAIVPNPYRISPAELYVRGASLRNVGMPLTIASVALFAVGIGLLVKGSHAAVDGCAGEFGCSDETDQYLAWGVVSILGSLVGLGVGIPLWAVGSYRMRRAVRMGFTPPTYAQPYVTPTHGGAVAGLRLLAF